MFASHEWIPLSLLHVHVFSRQFVWITCAPFARRIPYTLCRQVVPTGRWTPLPPFVLHEAEMRWLSHLWPDGVPAGIGSHLTGS